MSAPRRSASPASVSPVRLTVRTLSGLSFTLSRAPSSSLRDLSASLEALTGVPSHSTLLVADGRRLAVHEGAARRSIRAAGLREGSTVVPVWSRKRFRSRRGGAADEQAAKRRATLMAKMKRDQASSSAMQTMRRRQQELAVAVEEAASARQAQRDSRRAAMAESIDGFLSRILGSADGGSGAEPSSRGSPALREAALARMWAGESDPEEVEEEDDARSEEKAREVHHHHHDDDDDDDDDDDEDDDDDDDDEDDENDNQASQEDADGVGCECGMCGLPAVHEAGDFDDDEEDDHGEEEDDDDDDSSSSGGAGRRVGDDGEGGRRVRVNLDLQEQLCSMGFPQAAAARALLRAENDVGSALNWLLSQDAAAVSAPLTLAEVESLGGEVGPAGLPGLADESAREAAKAAADRAGLRRQPSAASE